MNSVIYKKKKRKQCSQGVVLLGCGVCPCGWGWVTVLWGLPGWGSLCLCSDWWSWISSLWRVVQCPVEGFGVSMGSECFWTVLLAFAVLDTSISTDTWKWLSAYLHCCQPPTCPWNHCWCFCSLAPPCTADWSLTGRGLCGCFLWSLITPAALWRLVCSSFSSPGLPSAPRDLCALERFVCFASLSTLGLPSVLWGFYGLLSVLRARRLVRATLCELFKGWEVRLSLFSAL